MKRLLLFLIPFLTINYCHAQLVLFKKSNTFLGREIEMLFPIDLTEYRYEKHTFFIIDILSPLLIL